MINFSTLKSTLNNSPIKDRDNALYQVVGQLISGLIESQKSDSDQEAEITALKPEYGSWKPIDGSGAGLVFTYPVGQIGNVWVRLDKLFVFFGNLVYPATGSGANAVVQGLPFVVNCGQAGAFTYYTSLGVMPLLVAQNDTILPFVLATGAQYTNAGLTLKDLRFVGAYLIL